MSRPRRAVLRRFDFLALLVRAFPRGLAAHQLLAGRRMLAFAEVQLFHISNPNSLARASNSAAFSSSRSI
jgi:hypothetical protein